MQVLKDEIRESIRLASIEEFKDKGYSDASIRTIAGTAGISVGNLYRYFDSKESLFDFILGPIYAHMEASMKLEYKMFFLDVNLLDHMELIHSIATSQKSYKSELYILLEKSKGSKYEGTKSLIIERLETMIKKNIISEVNRDKEIVNEIMFSKAFAAATIEGFSRILIESDEDDFIRNIIQFLEFTFKSTVRTMIAIRDGKINFRRISDEEIINSIGSGTAGGCRCS